MLYILNLQRPSSLPKKAKVPIQERKSLIEDTDNIEIEELTKGQDSLRDSWPCQQPCKWVCEQISLSHELLSTIPTRVLEVYDFLSCFPLLVESSFPKWRRVSSSHLWNFLTASGHQQQLQCVRRLLTWGVTPLRSHVGSIYIITDSQHAPHLS